MRAASRTYWDRTAYRPRLSRSFTHTDIGTFCWTTRMLPTRPGAKVLIASMGLRIIGCQCYLPQPEPPRKFKTKRRINR